MFDELKAKLRMGQSGQAGLGTLVITGVVVAITGLIGVVVFNQVNKTQTVNQPLFDLVPLIVAAMVIIGLIGGILFVFRR